MKKVFSILLLTFLLVDSLHSQNLNENESITKFGETILSMNKNEAINFIKKRGFRILTNDQLYGLGFDAVSVKSYIVGMGNDHIVCKIKIEGISEIKNVSIRNMKFRNGRDMFNDFENSGYTLDKPISSGKDAIFKRNNGKYTYVASVVFITNPNWCMCTTEMKRIITPK